MYLPKYTISDKILHSVISIETAKKEIRQTPLSPSIRRKILIQMRQENLYQVSKLVGSDLNREDVHNILVGKELNPRDLSLKMLVNYRNTIEFIQAALGDQYIDIDPNILLHINKILLAGWIDAWDAGRFRNSADEIDKRFDTWTNTSLIPPQEIDFRTFFYEILSWFKETRYLTHPILKVGIILYEIYKYSPFVAGNTVTLFSTAELLFAKMKYTLSGLFPVAKVFSQHTDEFLEGLSRSIQKDNVTDWLEKFTNGVATEMSSLRDEVYRLQDQRVAKTKKKLLGLNDRQLRILKYLRQNVKIQRLKVMQITDVSTMTAYRDLQELVDKGLIVEKGQGRGTCYSLVKSAEEESTENSPKTESEIENEEKVEFEAEKPKLIFGSPEEVGQNADGTSSLDDPFNEYR